MRNTALLIPFLLLASCANPWSVIRQAAPNPFPQAAHFEVRPLRFTKVPVVKPEKKAAFAQDRADMVKLFDEGFRESSCGRQSEKAEGKKIRVDASVVRMQFGKSYSYGTVFESERPTLVALNVKLMDASNRVLDEFETAVAESAPGGGALDILLDWLTGKSFTENGRLRSCADQLADRIVDYINWRKAGGKTQPGDFKKK